MTALVGRDQELKTIRSLLDSAAGEPPTNGQILVRGDPGIGKSALLGAAIAGAKARGMVVLTCTGIATEARMPFAGLQHLLWPVRGCVDVLAPEQRDGLLAALGERDGPVPPVPIMGLATAEVLLECIQRTGPVLVIADDVQWLDRPTAEVLAFAVTRLEGEPVVLLAARREDEGQDEPLSQAGWPELHLEPLDAEASAVMLDSNIRLDSVLRQRVLDQALGNPLALVELPLALSERAGRVPAEPMPLTARLEQVFGTRLEGLPPESRTVLLALALADESATSTALAAASSVAGGEITSAALDSAAKIGLVELDPPRVVFRHPLVRSAIHQAASIEERHEMHRALADALHADPDRRVWHRAAAALGPDEEISNELEEAARRATRRGAASLTLRALERAAQLSEQPGRRARLQLQAAKDALELGEAETTLRLIEATDPADLAASGDRAQLRYMYEVVGPGRTGADVLGAFADVAEEMHRDGDDAQAVDTLGFMALRAWWSNPHPDLCRRIAATADATGRHDDPRLATVLGMVDPIGHGRAVLDMIARRPAGAGDPKADYDYCFAATGIGACNEGLAYCAAAATGLRERGQLGLLGQTLLTQAWTAALVGRFDLASSSADEGSRLLAEGGLQFWVTGTMLVTAFVAARRGDADAANELTGQVEPFLLLANMPPMLAQAEFVRGVASMGAGRFEDAYDHLARIFDPSESPYHPHLRAWALVDLADAARHCGKQEEAAAWQAELVTIADATGSPLLLADLAVSSAMLAQDHEAGPLFEDSLRADLSSWPLHRARLLLAYGSWLRRQGQVTESRVPLTSARDTFDALGATVLGDRSRQELTAAGAPSEDRIPRALDNLSPQEWQIAQLAATGLTNREIGQQLFLSHRTVGSHLARIFPKLGITSRTQLAAAVATGSSA